MLSVLIELELFREVIDVPIDTDPNIACLAQVLKDRLILTLAVSNQRCQNHEPAPQWYLHDGIHDLLHCLAGDLPPAIGAVRVTNAGEEEAQIVVDLGHRAHSGAGVAAGPLLVDRDRRAQPLNVVHIWLLHLAQELPGIGGERFHIAALPLGIDGIKGQGALT